MYYELPEDGYEEPFIVKIAGDPGAGKTWALRRILEDEYERGVSGSDATVITFSRTAEEDLWTDIKDEEARNDDLEKLGEEFADSVTTMHGKALELAKDADDRFEDGEIITLDDDPDVFAEFFEEEFPGVGVSEDENDPLRLIDEGHDVEDVPKGNKLIAIYNYVRAQAVWDWSDHWRAPIDVSLRDSEIEEVLERWHEWKQENGYVQHADYLHYCLEVELTPWTDVLIVDEFQDLSPLLYSVFKLWRDDSRRVWIAGDAKQSIYSFIGGTPKWFDETPVDDVIRRDESYRCKQEIVDYATTLIDGDVGMTGYSEGGEVRRERVNRGNKSALKAQVVDLVDRHGDVMLLSRRRRGVGYLAHHLDEAGVPYTGVRSGDFAHWDEPVPTIYEFVKQVCEKPPDYEIELAGNGERNGALPEKDEVRVEDVEMALPFFALETQNELTEMLENFGELSTFVAGETDKTVKMWEVRQALGVTDDVSPVDVLERLDTSKRRSEELVDDPDLTWIPRKSKRQMQTCLRNHPEIKPTDVEVGTIHSSKGLEASAVVLSTEYTRSMSEQYRKDAEFRSEERRLYFVGATRASDELVVLDGFSGSDTAPPLRA